MAPSASDAEEDASTSLPLRKQADQNDFDIVATYHNLVAQDPDLTKPVAAIASLVELLNSISTKTVFETLDIVKANCNRLTASVENPVPLAAGADLFLQYLLASLKPQPRESGGSFEAVRQHLLHSGRVFTARAIAARAGVAESGWRFIVAPTNAHIIIPRAGEDGRSVLTHGSSRAVRTVLERAAVSDGGKGVDKFRVVYVRDEARAAESDAFVASLRARAISVAEIPPAAVCHVLGLLRQVHTVMVGAEAITQNGGIISRIGTFQIAQLAARVNIPFYVAAETHKFTRKFPLDQRDLGFKQRMLDFSTDGSHRSKQPDNAVDYTPPELISNLITEDGIHQTGYVFDQILEIYGSLNG